jgi:hypothetical protein
MTSCMVCDHQKACAIFDSFKKVEGFYRMRGEYFVCLYAMTYDGGSKVHEGEVFKLVAEVCPNYREGA